MNLPVLAGYFAAYVFLDWVSYVHPVLPLGITPWNPPPGLSLFLLLRGGLRYWPALFIAALGADVVVRGVPAQWYELVVSAGVIAGGYTTAAYLLLKRVRIRVDLGAPRDLGMFLAVVVPATLAVAAAFVALFTLTGAVPRDEFAANVIRYWVGDLNGILVLTPVLLAHARKGFLEDARGRLVEVLPQAVALCATLWIVLLLADEFEFKFFSLLFLPMTWVAARWGLRGATLALAAIQLGLIVTIQTGGYHDTTFIQLQFVMLALCVTGLVLGAVVTHRAQVEASLREKQAALSHALRFAAAGEMASALAHQLNQPMAAISNYLGACQTLLRDPAGDRRTLDQTMDKAVLECRRAAGVLHGIRDFFKRGATQPRSSAVRQLVQGAVAAIEPVAAQAGVRISVHSDADLPGVRVDPLQIESALQNVLLNAIEALAQSAADRRTIDISMLRRESCVEVTVVDNGPGIGPEIADRLFEPFNTSKAEGMGLGLAISRTLLRANGGDLSVGSSPDRGTRVSLTLRLDAAGSGSRT